MGRIYFRVINYIIVMLLIYGNNYKLFNSYVIKKFCNIMSRIYVRIINYFSNSSVIMKFCNNYG